MISPDQTLVVPIHLDAICVSARSEPAQDGSGFANAMLQNLDALPFHGDGRQPQVAPVSQQFHSPPFTQGSLEPGVHLHWAMPDALTHGQHVYQITAVALNEMRCLGVSAEVISAIESHINPAQIFSNESELAAQLRQLMPEVYLAAFQGLIMQAAGRFDFPQVPNRWLLVRVITDKAGHTPQMTFSVIESDFLSNAEIYAGHTAVPSPNGLADKPPWRYMGRTMPVSGGAAWQEDATAERYPNLTTLGYGELGFAAYYPNCRTVFGHHETVAQLQAPTYEFGSHRLTYAVIGWHSDPASDPLHPTNNRQQTLANLGWGIAGQSKMVPQRSVYYGIVHDVAWDPAKPQAQYMADVAEPIELAVGNTAAEALAAYLARHTPPGDTQDGGRLISAETLIEALQLDLLPEIHLADGDFEQLEHALHERAFRGHPGGSEWVIGKTLATHDGPQSPAQHFDDRAQAGDFTPVPLAPEVADQLSDLNELQYHYDNLQFETRERRWQLFADWHQSMQIDYPGIPADKLDTAEQQQLKEIASHLVSNGLTDLEAAFVELAQLAKTAVIDAATLQTKIGPDFTLRRVAAPRYWQPNDPTVLLAGSEVDPSIRYGQDGQDATDGLLSCRLDADVIAALGGNETIQGPKLSIPDLDSRLFDRLLHEVIFINRFFAGVGGRLDSTDIGTAIAPAPIALNLWGNAAHSGRNPWHPLLLHWEIDPVLISANDDFANLLSSHTALQPHELDLSYKEDTKGVVDETKPYRGVVLLTPHATKTLASQLKRLVPGGLDEALLTDLSRLPIMSQVLGGYHDSLLMRAQQNQFSIENPYNPQRKTPPGLPQFAPPLWKKVQAAVGRMNIAAPLPNAHYMPIRSGFAKLKQLWLVDAFGQFKAFAGNNLPSAIVPTTMRPPKAVQASADLMLVPRIVQPSRLLLRWVAADNAKRFMNTHPDTTPICGWVLPNHLDHSVMIYDNKGQLLGAIRASDTPANRWESAPGAVPPPTIVNKTLLKMVTYLRSLDKAAFTNYMQAVEQVLLTIEPPTYREHNALSVLMGRPLALAQMHLTAQIKGLPAVDQSFEKLMDVTATKGTTMRSDHHFTAVKLPVRLGDVVTERDGMVCSFSGTDGAFTAHHLEVDANGNHDRDDEDNLWLGLSTQDKEDTLTVTLLLDPRAKIHVTTGILPVQSLAIPPEFYTGVLTRMSLTFLVNPLLSAANSLTLPLPAEDAHTWHWFDPLHDWQKDLLPSDDRAHLDAGAQQIWEGWLQIRPYKDDAQA